MALSVSRRFLRVAAHPVVMMWASTWRVHVVNGERWEASRSSDTPTVFLFWHEALLPLLWHHRNQNLSTVVSDSPDGQHIADLAQTLGYRSVRGSSSKGATRVLLAAAPGRSSLDRGPRQVFSRCTPPPIEPGGSTPGTNSSSPSLLPALLYLTANHSPSARASKGSPRQQLRPLPRWPTL